MPIQNLQVTQSKQTIKPKPKLRIRTGKPNENKVPRSSQKNETPKALSQLQALGYEEGDRVYVRLIAPKKLPVEEQIKMGMAWEPEPGKKVPIPINGFLTLSEGGSSFTRLKKRRENGKSIKDDNGKPIWDESKHYEDGLNQLTRWNSQGYGVYFVVNPGGMDDKDITEARTLFYECDEVGKAEQWKRLKQLEFVLGSKSSLVVETRNSLHSYFSLTEPEEDLADWTQYQQRLIQGQDSDRSIWNPSRLMRLAGFDHKKWNEETQSIESVPVQIVQNCSNEFDLSDLDEFLPEWDKDLWGREETPREPIDLGEFSIRNFAQYLEGYNPDGREGWITCQCPTHTKEGGNHSQDSLHINASTGHFKCHTGCDPKQIYADAKAIALSKGFKPKQKAAVKDETMSRPILRKDKTAEVKTGQPERKQVEQAEKPKPRRDWTKPLDCKDREISAPNPNLKGEDLSQIYLDKKISRLGRQIAAELGDKQDKTKTFEGKYKYKVYLNTQDNTMRIYSRDRGVDPILVDANGRIDHDNSKVEPEDVKHFQAVVDQINLYYSKPQEVKAHQKNQVEI